MSIRGSGVLYRRNQIVNGDSAIPLEALYHDHGVSIHREERKIIIALMIQAATGGLGFRPCAVCLADRDPLVGCCWSPCLRIAWRHIEQNKTMARAVATSP